MALRGAAFLGGQAWRAYKSSRGSRPLSQTGSGIVSRKRSYSTVRKPMKKKKRKIQGSRTFRKAKKSRKKASVYAKRHYDDHGQVNRASVNYLGFQTHGSHDRVYDIIGEAVTKALLAKIRIYPRIYDEAIFRYNLHYDRLRLTFKRVTVPGGETQAADYHDIVIGSTTTFESLANEVATRMQSNGDGPNGVYGAFLESAYFYRNNDTSVPREEIKDIGDSIIDLYSTQVITLRNVTPNVTGNTNTDRVDVENLVGRKYVFYNHKPAVITSIYDKYPTACKYFQQIGDKGIISPTIAGSDEDHPFAHPPVARQLWSDCAKDTHVSLSSGQQKVEKTQFHIKMKLRELIEKVYYNAYDKGKFGGFVLFGFDRQLKGLSTNADKSVVVAFDRANHLSAHCQLVKQKTLLKHYQNIPYSA